MVGGDPQTRLASLYGVRMDPSRGMGEGDMEEGMTLVLILTTGFTFFVGQPNWYELDTRGVEWTVHETVARTVTRRGQTGIMDLMEASGRAALLDL